LIQPAVAHSDPSRFPVTVKSVRPQASLLRFFRDPVGFFRAVIDDDASLTRIGLGNRQFYMVTDPAIIRDILTVRGSSFEKFPQGNPKQKLFGNGLLTSEGAAQKQQRRMLLPAFHRERLQEYTREMVECTDRMMAGWKSQIDIAREMNDVTLEIVGRTLLGVSDPTIMRKLGEDLHAMLAMVNRFVAPWGDLLMKVPLPSTIRYLQAVERLDHRVYELIEQAHQPKAPDSLIRMLIETKHIDGTAVSREQIRDEVVTMIVAGHETVAVGLTWCLNLLATHGHIQEQLSSQAAEILGNRSPEADDYPKLEFLQHAVAESLRLHPPIWILGRRNLDDYHFGNFHAPKGSIFLVCISDLHRRSRFFDRPDVFDPARWANPYWPTYAYIPFGGGDRRCIGERFAWIESVIILARLLQSWQFSTTKTQRAPDSVAKLTLHPRGPVWLQILDRRSPTAQNC
jgi:cytochrome P450